MRNYHKSIKAKALALLLAVITLLSLATTSVVYAESTESDGAKEQEIVSYSFTENGVHYVITGEDTVAVNGFAIGTAVDTNTITLDKVTSEGKQYTVTAIWNFKELGTGEYTVILGDKVTTVANGAFKNCENTTIQFKDGKNLKTVGSEAFRGIKAITNSLKDFENLTSVGKNAFDFEGVNLAANDKGFVLLADGKLLYRYEGEEKKVTLPSTVTTICGGAFAGKTIVSEVVLNKCTSILGDAFNGCTNLTTLNGVEKVSVLGKNALKDTKFLENLVSNDGFCRLSENKEDAGYKVLAKYTGKETTVAIPEGIAYIGSAFVGNETITKVIIPASVQVISEGAFAGCIKLADITMTNNADAKATLSIEDEAFKGTAIKAIFIPTQTVTLAANAFADCENLQQIQVSNKEAWLTVGGGVFDQEMVSYDKYTAEDQKRSKEDDKGILSYVNMLFGWVMLICSKISGGIYLIALFIFAVFMKVVLFPFGIKQQKSMVKQAAFRPKEMAIQAKYKGRTDRATVQKMQQEIMEARQKENISMFGGCAPLLLQLPILLILFNVIMNPLQYICGATTGTIEVLTERAINLGLLAKSTGRDVELVGILRDNFAQFEGLDGLLDAGIKTVADLPNFTIGSFDLAEKPVFGLSFTVLIPILTFVVSYYSMKLNRKMSYQAPTPGGEDAALSLKIMDFAMPALSTWICFMYPSVIGCYWIFQNILSTVQQVILKKMYPLPEFTEEDYKKAEKELMGKNKNRPKPAANYDPNKPKVRSLHHIDDEDELPAPTKPSVRDDRDDDAPEGNSSIGKADLK